MQVEQRGAAGNGRAVERGSDSAAIAQLRATCRRQAWAIETMTRVLANLRAGVAALKAENAELRGSGDRASDLRSTADLGRARDAGECVQACVPLDARAPGAARIVVDQVLGERVAAIVLERAKLVMSELVSNSVRHSGAAGGSVVIRVRLVAGGFWFEVEDSGRDRSVMRSAADRGAEGGFGLRIVDALSERWGIERRAQGGTRAWAQLSDAAPHAALDAGETAGATQPAGERVAGLACAEVHVIPEPRAATWGVYVEDVPAPVSEHGSETEAESAARAHVRGRAGGGIVIHDRYHRTHTGSLDRGR
jgi:anti-sigma regulatory factor (Ser/Thr protein kinase)